MVTGPSGVGKGTLLDRVLPDLPDAERSVSATTRPPRPGERDGVDYHFVDDEAFDRMVAAGELLEWAAYGGRRYGTPAGPVADRVAQGCTVVLEIEVQGALQVRERRPDALLIFVAPPDRGELARRLAARGSEDDAERAERLRIAEAELAAVERFDHVVVNDRLDRAAAELRAILTADPFAPRGGAADDGRSDDAGSAGTRR